MQIIFPNPCGWLIMNRNFIVLLIIVDVRWKKML